jgi:hypothetical protein
MEIAGFRDPAEDKHGPEMSGFIPACAKEVTDVGA